MENLLSDDDVFGSKPSGNLLSDDDVFGGGSANKGTGLRRAADAGISVLKGAIGVPEAVVGLADIPTAGYAGKAAEAVGFRPKEAKQFLDDLYSPQQKMANQEVKDAKGFVPTLGAAIQNPSVVAQTALESIPSMGAGGLVGRGVLAVAPKVAPLIGAAIGEGVIGAGSSAEQIRQGSDGGLLSGKQSLSAIGSGIGTGALALAGGKAAQKLGISDIDTAIAAGATQKSSKGLARRVGEGFVSEGALEEMPQSAQEQMWQNYATGKPLSEGVPEQAAMGLLAGGLMGGGFNAVNSGTKQEANQAAQPQAGQPNDEQQQPAGLLPAPTYTGTPNEQMLQAEVKRQGAVDAAQAKSDALWQARQEEEMRRNAAMEAAGVSVPAPTATEAIANSQPAAAPAPKPLPDTGPLSRAANLSIASRAPATQQDGGQLFPFNTPEAAARYIAGREGFEVVPHPRVAGRFAAVPVAQAPQQPSIPAVEQQTSQASKPMTEADLLKWKQTYATDQDIPGIGVAPQPILSKVGKPWPSLGMAKYAAQKYPGYEPVQVGKGWGLQLKQEASNGNVSGNTANAQVAATGTQGKSGNVAGGGNVLASASAGNAERASNGAEMAAQGVRQPMDAGDSVARSGVDAAPAADLSGEKLNKFWTAFAADSGTLGIPRAEMPQIKAEHRGAMTQFMDARGVKHKAEEVSADSLRPTQAEFSPSKVKKAIGYQGGDRSILVSSDGYVLDGHHQWLAKREKGEKINVIRFDAPISDLIKLAHEFPSSKTAGGATKTNADEANPKPDSLKYAKPSSIDSPAQGVLAAATERKKAAHSRVKALRQRIKDEPINGNRSGLRLELLKAEGAHKEAIRNEEDALAQIEKGANRMGLTTKRGPRSEPKAASAQPANASAMESRAWHGSPHKFDKFSTSAMGTGEGVQAYGWGLYFAGSKEVAEWYRDTLSKRLPAQIKLEDGRLVKKGEFPAGSVEGMAWGRVFDELKFKKGRPSGLQDAIKNVIAEARNLRGANDPAYIYREKAIASYLEENWSGRMEVVEEKGRLYQVSIPDDDQYLLWDKPLSEQPEVAREPLKYLRDDFAEDWLEGALDRINSDWGDLTGKEIYKLLTRALEDDAINGILPGSNIDRALAEGRADMAASLLLREDGIAGIKFLDGTSRSSGDGSYNYVVFNENDIEVTGMQSKAAQPAGRVTMEKARLSFVQRTADAFREQFKGTADLDIRVVFSRDEIPQEHRPSPYAEGVYHGADGVVYLIAKNIPTKQRAFSVLMHETVGHYSLANMMGEKFASIWPMVLEKARAGAELKSDPGPGDKHYETVEAVRRLYPDASDNEVAQEVLARMAETMNPPGWVRVTIARIRHWIGKIAEAMGIKMEPSLQDARDLVVLAADRLRTGRNMDGEIGGQDLAFASRGATQESRLFHKVRAFVRAALSNNDQFKFIDFADVDTKAADSILKDTGIDVSGFKHTIDADAVRHVVRKHGNMEKEISRGQIGINEDDLAMIPDIVENYDSVTKGSQQNSGLDTLVYQKTYGNGETYYVEEVRTGRKKLVSKSMWKVGPAVPRTTSGDGVAQTSKTSGGQPSSNLAKEGKEGNGLESRSVTTSEPNQDGKFSTIKDWLKGQFTQNRGFMMGTLSLDQIDDIYGKEMPAVREFSKTVQAMDVEKQKISDKADALVERWRKLDSANADKLADVMHQATLSQFDPDTYKPTKLEPEKAKLRGEFLALPEEAQQLYRDVRDAYKDTLYKVRDGLSKRAERAGFGGAKIAAEIRLEFDKYLEEGPYFPLARFGDFLLISSKGDERIVEAFETVAAREKAMRQRKMQGFKTQAKHKVEFSQANDGAAGQFAKVVLEKIDGMPMDAATKSQLMDDLNQLAISSLPDASYRKHFAHRKGVAGFSNDAMRAFASSQFHAAHHIARINHADRLGFAIDEMNKEIRDEKEADTTEATQVLNEMKRRLDHLMNPTTHPLASALGNVGFVMSLGGSIASGLANLSQTPLVAFPVLGARYGFDKASGALLQASKDYFGGKWDKWSGWVMTENKSLAADERDALVKLQNMGKIDLTQAHDLAGVANTNQASSKTAFAMSRAMKIIGWTFHLPEVFNRQVTALATYRLAKEKGMTGPAAIDEAARVLDRSHFNYAASNRARIFQGNMQRVITMFKQYSQNMTYLLWRNTYLALKGEDPAVRKEARRMLMGVAAMHFAAAGTLGLPLGVFGVSTALLPMLAMGMGDEDDPWDWEVEYRNMLAQAFGTKGGEVIAKGPMRAILPWADFASRVGLGDLWVRGPNKEMEGRAEVEAWMLTLLGPVAGYAGTMGSAVKSFSDGKVERGIEQLLPKMLSAPLKAARYGTEGVKSIKGDDLGIKLDGGDILFQALGFTPSDISEMYDGRNAIKNRERRLEMRRSEIVNQWIEAKRAGDSEGMREAMQAGNAFSQKNPSMRITLNTFSNAYRAKERNAQQIQNGVFLSKKRAGLREEGAFADL